jgi:hypothetical protein
VGAGGWWSSLRALTGSLPDDEPAPGAGAGAGGSDGISPRLASAAADRANMLVATRTQAMQLSVVNRARDLICGVIAGLPFRRVRTRNGVDEDLGPGWLGRPDPTHTRGWFVAQVTDDLFFHEVAFARVTARDTEDFPLALQWMPRAEVMPNVDGSGNVTWLRTDHPGEWWWPTLVVEQLEVEPRDLIVFESPVSGLLRWSGIPLTTAARLDAAANRFAGVELAAGWLAQKAGSEDLNPTDARAMLEEFSTTRTELALAYLNQSVEYHESQMNPSQLQLVEGRAYQDAATARLCNVPNYAVGVGVPNDSMTYKTAVTARLDLIDFGIAPFLTCWEQTLSAYNVTPRGTQVLFDLEPFLRTHELATMPADQTAPAPTPASASKG